MKNYPYVITISSEKGGVGKTTLATNLAIFLKALHENLPVSIFSFDNHFTIDKMFAIKGQKPERDVADLLMETPGHDLLCTGQYGVNYIPSSTALSGLKGAIKGPMVLARLLATSQIPGILIIDTRPDLDILTQNALFAADQVIIPIKDMASMENCRNIFDLFDKRGMDKKSLALIPCLVDERVKYDGMFSDQKTLLKAYAINRGYRCHDTYISKSPKVEGLNTNPDGKIYPILTHARNTDVFGQFTQLARTVLKEMKATAEPRSLLFHQWTTAEDARKKDEFFARLSGVKSHCIMCGSPADRAQSGIAYFYETSDGSDAGFMEESCFSQFLLSSIYNMPEGMASDDPVRLMLQDTLKESAFAFKPVSAEGGTSIECHRFDLSGAPMSGKAYPLGRLSPLLETLKGYGETMRDAFLLVHPITAVNPEAILMEENYREFSRLKRRIAEQIS
ncbi:ParA family protein [Geotalea sp. SG265]|uniref:ParA family protein n=1 Tax=Geotalea sp. SG265 TaxID=2922867 RepID=UPI001FAF734E|nr:ParA family protein [Geotalea sp. SG265]